MSPETPTQEVKEELKLPDFLPEERSEEYLARITKQLDDRIPKLVGGISLSKVNPQNYPENLDYVNSAIAAVSERDKLPKEKFSEEKQNRALEVISKSISGSTNRQRLDENGNISFSHTNQSRDFFGDRKTGKIDNRPYSGTLFNLSVDTPESREYLAEKINDKTIYLLGGGDSIKDLIASDDFHPKHVVNFDPYITSEPIEKFDKGIYQSIPVPVQNSEEVKEEIKKQGLPKADEMWASFSVPYYLATGPEIKGMFKTIRESLAENGTARIVPLRIQDEDPIFHKGSVDEFMNQVQELADSPEFNVYSTGETMFIERLSSEMPKEKVEEVDTEQAEFERRLAEREETDKTELAKIRGRLGI